MRNAVCRLLKMALSSGVWAACLVSPASALTLTEAYQSAVLNDPVFQSDVYAAQAGKEEKVLGRSNLLPEVSLTARKMENWAQVDSSKNALATSSLQTYQSLGESIYVRQPLLNLRKLSASKEGELRAEVAESQWVSGKQNVILRVTDAFLDAIIVERKVEFSIAKRKSVEAQSEQASRFYSKGEATLVDADAGRSRLELALILENESNDDRLTKISALSQLTARVVSALPELNFEPEKLDQDSGSSKTLDQWLELALANNPDIIQKRLSLELAENEIKSNLSGDWPNIDLVANISRNNQDSFTTLNQDIKSHGVGIEMNWSLYKGGYNSALVRQARAKAEQSRQDVAAAKIRLRLEVERQYRKSLTGRLKINALSQAIKTDQERVKLAESLLGAGVKTLVDVLIAQEDLLQTKKDFGDALKEFVMAHLKLRVLAGSLADDQIAWVEKYLLAGRPH